MIEPAHRQDTSAEPRAIYCVVSRCRCRDIRVTDEKLEVVDELSWRSSGVRVEAIAAREERGPEEPRV